MEQSMPEPINDHVSNANLSSEELLKERQRLEALYKEKFTREVTVMFTDLKDSTALTESKGDLATRELIQQHNSFLFPLIEEHQGTLVKTMGDGTMSYFESAQQAQRTAVKFQQALHCYNQEHHNKTPILVRIGIHTGTGIVEENDIYGDVVNVAARFEALAGASEIYMSDHSYQALDNKGEFYSRIVKQASLKGKSEKFHVYKVFWNEEEAELDKESGQAQASPASISIDKKGGFRVLIFVAVLLAIVFGLLKLTAFIEDKDTKEEKRSREHKIGQSNYMEPDTYAQVNSSNFTLAQQKKIQNHNLATSKSSLSVSKKV